MTHPMPYDSETPETAAYYIAREKLSFSADGLPVCLLDLVAYTTDTAIFTYGTYKITELQWSKIRWMHMNAAQLWRRVPSTEHKLMRADGKRDTVTFCHDAIAEVSANQAWILPAPAFDGTALEPIHMRQALPLFDPADLETAYNDGRNHWQKMQRLIR